MPEWLNGPVSKTGVSARAPWVRIPLSPLTPIIGAGSCVFTLTGKHLRAVLLGFALALTACSSAIAGGNRLAAQDAVPTIAPLILVQASTPLPRPEPTAPQTPEPTRVVLWWPEQLAPGNNPMAMELLTSQLEAFQSFLGNVTLQLRLKSGSGRQRYPGTPCALPARSRPACCPI